MDKMDKTLMKYKKLLSDYLTNFEEANLLQARDFAKNVAIKFSISKIVDVHFDALSEITLTSEKIRGAQKFLLEVIMAVSVETGLQMENVLTALYEEAVINFFKELEKNWEREKSLHKWSQRLNQADSLEEVYEYTLDAIEKTLKYKLGLVFLEKDNALKVKAHRGFKDIPFSSHDLPLDEKGLTVKAFNEEETVFVNDVNHSPEYIAFSPNINSELAAPIKSEGEVLGVLDVQSVEKNAFNQSDKRLLEMLASYMAVAIKEIREKEQLVSLRRLDELRNRFLIMAAHEIGTPLTPIKSRLEMLQKGYQGDLTSEQKRTVDSLLESVDRLNRLVKDFNRISKLETGRLDIEKSEHQLTTTFEKAIQKYKPVLREERIMILTEESQKPPRAIYDEDRIIQVIRNILENAIDYTKGRIIIKIGQDEEKVWFSISDNGPGIPAEVKDKIFQPFYRVEDDRYREDRLFGGTGLGLHICKQIVEAHRGKIHLESQLQEGTTFTVKLPKSPKES